MCIIHYSLSKNFTELTFFGVVLSNRDAKKQRYYYQNTEGNHAKIGHLDLQERWDILTRLYDKLRRGV